MWKQAFIQAGEGITLKLIQSENQLVVVISYLKMFFSIKKSLHGSQVFFLYILIPLPFIPLQTLPHHKSYLLYLYSDYLYPNKQ